MLNVAVEVRCCWASDHCPAVEPTQAQDHNMMAGCAPSGFSGKEQKS